MLRATFRSLLARKLRLVLSALAIVIGVGFVSGAFVLTDSLSRTFDSVFSNVNQHVAVAVRGAVTTSREGADVRKPVPVALVDRIRSVDGVKDAKGSVVGIATVVGKNGKAVTTQGPPNLGLSWVDGPLQSGHLVAGTAPATADQIVLNAYTADRGGYAVGARVPVLTDGPVKTYTVSGILEYANNRKSLAGETTVWFADDEAHRVLGRPGTYDEVDVLAADGVSQTALRDRVQAVLTGGAQAVTGKQLADEQSSDIKQGLKFFNTFLLVFAAIALFVGSFIIFNTFSMLVAQRTRELALLRAIGASRGQVIRSVLVEAVAVGLLASGLGLLAGIGLSAGLKSLLGAVGADLPDGPVVVEPRTVLVSFVVGTVITALAALLPARRGSKIAPIAALRDASTPDRPLGRQAAVGAVILAVGLAGIAAGLSGSGLLWLGIGTLLGFLGIATLSPLLARPIAGTVGLAFQRGLAGRLGGRNTVRNPRRTAVTASALMVGLALIGGVTVLGASFKDSVAKITQGSVGSDFILNVKGQQGFSDSVVSAARAVPGVTQVDTIKGDMAKVTDTTPGAKSIQLLAVPSEAIGSTLTLQRVSGQTSGLSVGQVLLSKKAADSRKLHVGQSLRVLLADGSTQSLAVRGTYKDNALAGDYIVASAEAKHFTNERNFAALVLTSDKADNATVRAALDKAVASNPTVQVQDRSEFVKQTQDQVQQIVSFLNVLLLLSVIIAILGVVNTLALSVIERTRELGLLRAVGMSRRQVKRMIRVESVVICIFGGVLGLVVGVGMGVALQHALAGQGITELGLPVGTMLMYLVVAALAGVLAAVLPARRASKLDVLEAIATE